MDWRRSVPGYLAAMLVASATLIAPTLPHNFDLDVGTFVVASVLIVGAIASVIAFGPFVITLVIARAVRTSSVFLYVGVAIGASVSVATVIALWADRSLPVGDPEHLAFGVAMIRYLPAFSWAGLLSGMTYWSIAGRFSVSAKL